MKCNAAVFPSGGIAWRDCGAEATHWVYHVDPDDTEPSPRCGQHADLAQRRGLEVRLMVNGTDLAAAMRQCGCSPDGCAIEEGDGLCEGYVCREGRA